MDQLIWLLEYYEMSGRAFEEIFPLNRVMKWLAACSQNLDFWLADSGWYAQRLMLLVLKLLVLVLLVLVLLVLVLLVLMVLILNNQA